MDRGLRDATPAARLKAPTRENRRDRVLSDYEIKAIWDAADRLGYPFGPMFHMLLITGQRRNEVARMRWSDIHLDERLWTIPREVTKSDRTHVVPLSPLAFEILGSLPRFNGDYVFTSTYGQKPVSGYSRAKQRAEKTLNEVREREGLPPLPDWRLHDFRRTVATSMAGSGIAGDIIARVLNHAPRGVTAQIYNRHSYLPEKTRALQAWGKRLQLIVGSHGSGDKVVELTTQAI
jgi:integrase